MAGIGEPSPKTPGGRRTIQVALVHVPFANPSVPEVLSPSTVNFCEGCRSNFTYSKDLNKHLEECPMVCSHCRRALQEMPSPNTCPVCGTKLE